MDPLLLSVRALSDSELLESLRTLVASDARLEADLLVHLLELDGRELYLGLGHLYHRIAAARAARSFPRIVELVRTGELHLSGVRLLAPHLTREKKLELLSQARHKSKRAIERMLADRAPKPDVPAQVRRLPERAPSIAPPARPADTMAIRATVPGVAVLPARLATMLER